MTTVSLTLQDLRKLVELAGFTPSVGSFEDDEKIWAFSGDSIPGTMGHPRFALEYRKATGELFNENRPYYPGTRGDGADPAAVTTEDLIATCQNYPETIDARVAAIVLERRVGPNRWTAAVARRLASKYFTWTLSEGRREHASADAQREHWKTIEGDPRARYWREEATAAGKPEGACKWWLNCTIAQ